MEQPLHLVQSNSRFSPQRIVAFAFALLLQAGFVYALVSGLAATLIQKLPEELKAEVVQEKLPDKTPPPPPPELQRPPPPVVPPPDIVIQQEAVSTNSIQTVSQKPNGITAPFSIGRAHSCGGMNYPSVALRLAEEGSTVVTFTIGIDGYPKNITIKESSGHDELDQATVPCVSRWHYNPAMQNGQPVEVSNTAKVVWKIPK